MAGPPGAGKKMEGVDNLELGEKQKEEMLRHLTSIANDTQVLSRLLATILILLQLTLLFLMKTLAPNPASRR